MKETVFAPQERERENILNVEEPKKTTLPGYQSQYAGQINDIYSQISQRKPFSYDVNADAMYQQMKDQYIQGGRMAMMDTMGQAQAMTGGYGNSYAQGVGQQAYQGYLQGLNDAVPELYQMALNNYMNEGDRLNQQYSMLMDMDANEYGRYQDQMALIQPQVIEMLKRGITPTKEMLDASGLSPEYIAAVYGKKKGGSGGGAGGSGGGDKTGLYGPFDGYQPTDDSGEEEPQPEQRGYVPPVKPGEKGQHGYDAPVYQKRPQTGGGYSPERRYEYI